MSEEIIWGIDMNNSTTNHTPVKRYCRQTGNPCERATDFGYCKLTSCFKKSYSGQCLQTIYRYGSCPNCGADMRGEQDETDCVRKSVWTD